MRFDSGEEIEDPRASVGRTVAWCVVFALLFGALALIPGEERALRSGSASFAPINLGSKAPRLDTFYVSNGEWTGVIDLTKSDGIPCNRATWRVRATNAWYEYIINQGQADETRGWLKDGEHEAADSARTIRFGLPKDGPRQFFSIDVTRYPTP